MAADANNLMWVDMEMSGLDPEIEKVLEVAIVVTDTQLNTVAEAPVIGRASARRGARRDGRVEQEHARQVRA